MLCKVSRGTMLASAAARSSDQRVRPAWNRHIVRFGGEGGIRTHVALITPTRFRDEPLKPLGHPSTASLPPQQRAEAACGAYHRVGRNNGGL